jgi:hypothetical protein
MTLKTAKEIQTTDTLGFLSVYVIKYKGNKMSEITSRYTAPQRSAVSSFYCNKQY